jgi:alpha-amylase/alpha-mannosidase (GH57 family)
MARSNSYSSLTQVAEMANTQIFITVHGHFYQPPRENPYLDTIERQASAHPYHDWNERIFYECYRPNAYARIHNHRGELVQIVNNYEYLSFNMGATLLSWLEKYDRATYERILLADRLSAQRLDGHGNAIAQVYNHIIMPLASWRDKLTQIRWGKADFHARFGRAPEGMWLAETAIDYETVEALIQEGIKFTSLAPSQAQRVRSMTSSEWIEVGGGQIDPTRPYRCFLPDRSQYLDIFFYDGPISRDMGFGDLLSTSCGFADRLAMAIHGDDRPSQLIAVATDGETFGHHKHFTDKSLAYAFVHEFNKRGWTVTNFAHYLSQFPPTWEVELKPVTAWSCAHGVDRWQDDCGCGAQVGYGTWRRPLRNALNWLRDRIHTIYQQLAVNYFRDPWRVRDKFISVILDRAQWQEFWQRYGEGDLTDRARQLDAIRLLEMERHVLLSFTSCGWFFEEISRPEGVQILRYAGRAIDLVADVAGILLESEFMALLEKCPTNVAEYKNGADIYRRCVLPAKVSMEQIAVYYGIQTILNATAPDALYCYQIRNQDCEVRRIGNLSLAISQIQIESRITFETRDYLVAVVHLGADDFHCVLTPFTGRKNYEETKQALWQALDQTSSAQVILAMHQHCGDRAFNLQALPKDDRQAILQNLVYTTLSHLDQVYAEVYRDNASLLASFQRNDLPAPPELQVAAQITLNQELRKTLQELESGNISVLNDLDRIVHTARSLQCTLDETYAQQVITAVVLRQIQVLQSQTRNHNSLMAVLENLRRLLACLDELKPDWHSDVIQEYFLNYLRSQVMADCPLVVQVLQNGQQENLPAILDQPLCSSISNPELQKISELAVKLKISPLAWGISV